MACEEILRQSLSFFAVTTRQKDEYINAIEPVWNSTFYSVKDRDLMSAVKTIAISNFSFPPTIAAVIAEVEKIVKGQGGKGLSKKEYKFCKVCQPLEGLVIVYYHYHLDDSEEIKRREVAAACNCTGSKEKYPSLDFHMDIYDWLKDNKRVNLLSFVLSSDNPSLIDTDYEMYCLVEKRKNEDPSIVDRASRQVSILDSDSPF